MINIHEQHVRELAYQIWESEGRPIGREYRHWEMASRLVELQGEASLTDPVEPKKRSRAKAKLISDESAITPVAEKKSRSRKADAVQLQ